MSSKWIYWFEELDTNHFELVGRKCANLGEMTSLGMRVPPGFAISVEGYSKYLALTGLGETIKEYFSGLDADIHHNIALQMEASNVVKGMMEQTPMPDEMIADLSSMYKQLKDKCNLEEVHVAVRSSGAVSMPGQMDSYLNVVGEQIIIEKVLEVWQSTFNTRALAFRLENKLPVDQAPIGVAVMKMANAKSAGVILTVAPTTGDTSKVVVEGNWGLGESVVAGDVEPDNFIVDKAALTIEATICKKTKYVISNGQGTKMVDVPAELQEKPCLDDKELLEIVRISMDVENHFGVPQDMEWVVDQDMTFPESIIWVQARPAKFTAPKADADMEYLLDQMTNLFRM